MQGDNRVDDYMHPVAEAISRYVDEKTTAWTDIYNRAYEAVHKAIQDAEVGKKNEKRSAYANGMYDAIALLGITIPGITEER